MNQTTILILEYSVIGMVMILFLLSYLHKMVAVETMLTFQIIFLCSIRLDHQTEYIKTLELLTYSTGNFMYFFNRSNHFYTSLNQKFTYNQLNQIFTQSFVCAYVVICGVIALFIKLIGLTFGEKFKNSKSNYIFIYNHVGFPFMSVFLIPAMLQLNGIFTKQRNDRPLHFEIISVISMVLCLLVILVFYF